MSNQQNMLARPVPLAAADGSSNVAELPLDGVGDAALLGALVQGNQRAAAVIWQRYSTLVRRALARSLGPDQEIEDLLQEVFIGFIKSAAKVDQRASLRAYLISIAYRTAAMEIRKRKVRRWVTLTPSGDVPEVPSSNAGHDGLPDEGRALRSLYRILDTLSARDRLIFIARHIDGMQIDETAVALKVSRATVWRTGKATLMDVLAKAQRDPALAAYVERALQNGKDQ